MMKSVLQLLLVSLLSSAVSVSAFTTAPSFIGTPLKTNNNNGLSLRSSSSTMLEMKYTLVLVRHGESTWNDENRFTGWYDCPLSEKGLSEAADGARLLKEAGFTFDVAYTSTLKRAIKTLWTILEELDLMYIPIINSWRCNERHYGALQGLNKQETVDKHGKDQVLVWRRSYDIPPPPVDESSEYYPGNDPMYKDVPKEDLPFTESLKLTEDRFLVEWDEKLVPLIKSGKKVIIAAHGNTLRALVKHLDGISKEEIPGLNIPTGVPLVYELDENMKPIPQDGAIAPLTGLYLGDLEKVRERIGAVAAQTK
mmetsp:Transcript_2131/g.4927  ORF Transcript_2131/g.4927 Transcript_2131/m.4927 type:complete len:310 (-) Transcript_2131:283-1212(-)|eukprot:CAMPEP_0113458330 /NCGR_PEP_ID=MMETSP0014_2-20120614/9868_1 /TAXON_ID=2857 /ORGANISM="Nitzschia sp." /LENGTH=309 /DNA_ID=CAMNT_0000349853 /DNA_START=145 /DNA_END=1074 /DNA_ORIENTATION=+ /assembly_acc=CAM_ASM_000159